MIFQSTLACSKDSERNSRTKYFRLSCLARWTQGRECLLGTTLCVHIGALYIHYDSHLSKFATILNLLLSVCRARQDAVSHCGPLVAMVALHTDMSTMRIA